jgi:hypothetical protein
MKVKVSLFERDNYHTTIEIPDYKQVGRIVSALRKYVLTQGNEDEKNKRMRFYIFNVEPCESLPRGMYMTEADLYFKG